jgi:hypothetical protein
MNLCCLPLPGTARNDTVEYYPCLTWLFLSRSERDLAPKKPSNYPIYSSCDYTLFSSLEAISFYPFLLLFTSLFLSPFFSFRTTTHTSLYCQFLLSFIAQDDSHCYPCPGLISFSFYAPCNEFPFHRFQSLIVYCIIIMHV